MQAAWWGWHAVAGRSLFPSLRVLFGASAGLAPVHHERHVARGGRSARIDPEVFVDTSSYGRQGVDALARVLGIDVLVLGSDRPYGEPLAGVLGDAATRAIRETNPRRLLDVRTEGAPRAVAVVAGELSENNLTVAAGGVETRMPAGKAFSFGPEHIHRLNGALPGSVSVHAYSPPLWRMGQYAVSDAGVLRRVSVSYADEVRRLD